jgi:hypothetical protein
MAWTSPWSEPDPLEKRRRQLEAEAKELAEKSAALQETITNSHNPQADPTPAVIKPVWRSSDDQASENSPSSKTPGSRGKLRAHRQQDRNLFVALLVALVVVLFVIARCAAN